MQKIVLLLTMAALGLGVSNAHAQKNTNISEHHATGLIVESRVKGHGESLWMHFNDSHSHELSFEVVPKLGQQGDREYRSDIVEMLLHDAIAACESGDINLLPLDRILSKRNKFSDYVSNGLHPCGIGHSIWADFIAFDATMYINQPAPNSIRDFFDPDAFPGKRALKKSPRSLAEWILLLSGGSPVELYSMLSEENAWDKIEDTLRLIEPEIVWVDTDHEALQLLDAGAVRFIMVANYNLVRRIDARRKSELPFDHYGVVWSDVIAHMSMLTVPKQRLRAEASLSATAPEQSLEFLRYMLEPMRNVQLSTALGYAPVNRLQVDFIDKAYRKAMPVDLQPGSFFWGNNKWWREMGSGIEKKFSEYIEKSGSIKTAGF